MEYVTGHQLQEVVNELLKQIAAVRLNVLAALDAQSDSDRADFESELNKLRLELADVRSELETEITNLGEELDNQ
jgi:hypothetical protein